MSSFLRFLGGREFLNIYKFVNQVYPKRTLLEFRSESIASSWQNKLKFTRSCATLSSIETNTQPKNYQIYNDNLRTGFFQIDSILRRNNRIKDTSIKKLTGEVKQSAASGVPITPQQILFLLHCCRTSASREDAKTNIEMVMDIWTMCQEHGLPLDISHYNALLEIFLENEHKFSPDDFLSTLKEKNLQPNHITYNRLIARFCQEGDTNQAMKLFDLMKEKGLTITEHVFNSLIMGYSRSKDLEGARTILDLMKKSDYQPSPDTHAALLEAYAENGNGEDLKTLLDQCKKDEIFLSYRTLLNLLCTVVSNPQQDDSIKEVILDAIQKEDYDKSAFESAVFYLLNSGHDQIAHKVLRTLNPKDRSHHLSSLPKHIASLSQDLSRLVSLCDVLFNQGINVIAFELALQALLQDQKFNFALDLLKEMRERQILLKEHYYYPLICHFGRVEGKEKVWEIFEEMVKFDINISEEFFSTFFLPSLGCSDEISELEQIYLRFLSHRAIIINRAFNGVVVYLLMKQNVKTAADFVHRFPRGLRMTIGKLLSIAFLKVGDVENTVHLVHQLLPLSIRRDLPNKASSYDGLRDFLFSTIRGLKSNPMDFEERFVALLRAMEKNGIRFPPNMADSLKTYISDHLSEDIQELLNHLSNPLFDLVQPNSVRRTNTVEEARRKMEMAEANSDLKLNYLCALIREKEMIQSKEFVAKLKVEEVFIPPTVLVCLLDLYLEEEETTEAFDVFHQILSEHPGFQLHASKVLKYANSLASQEKYEEAAKALQIASPEEGIWTPETSPQLDKIAYRQQLSVMLSSIAEKDLNSFQAIQEILLARRFAPPSLVVSPLIKYYLDQKNVEEAFSTFKKIANESGLALCDIEMLKAAIEKEDKDMLQEIVELNNKIHGEMNSWYTLAFALLEMDKFKQAEKIFRTPGIRALPGRLNGYCQYLIGTEKIAELELLVKATKDLFGADRPRLYERLLEGRISQDDPDEALGVWMKIQEENVIPTEAFLLRLASFLRSKDIEVPFVVPDVPNPPEDRDNVFAPRTVESPEVMRLTMALEKQNLPSIQSVWTRLKETGEEVSLSLLCRVIGSFLKFDQIEEALIETKSLLIKGQLPHRNTMKRLLEKLSSRGDVPTIEFLKKYMNEGERRDAMFTYFFGLSHLNAGRMGEYLNTVLKSIEANEPSPTTTLTHGLSRGLIMTLMRHHPEHTPMLERCAEALKEKGNRFMYSQLWDFYFSVGDLQKAEEVYSKHLTEENQLTTREISFVCRTNEDTKKLDDVLQVLNRKAEGREPVKGRIYSNYIDIFNAKGEFQKALEVVENSLKTIKLEHYRLSSLLNLERQLKKNGLTFPYSLRVNAMSTSSSSSSSSED